MSKSSKSARQQQQQALYKKALAESQQGIKHNRSWLKAIVIFLVIVVSTILISIYNARSYYQQQTHSLEYQKSQQSETKNHK